MVLDKFLPTFKVDIQNDDTNMPPQYQLTLEQQYYGLSQLYQANDHLDNKALSLLQAAGLILALVGALEIPNFITTNEPVLWAKIGIGIGFAAFVLMVITITTTWTPKEVHLPGSQDWDKVYDDYVTVKLERSFDQHLVNILDAFERAALVNSTKSARIRVAVILFVFQVSGLLILAMAS